MRFEDVKKIFAILFITGFLAGIIYVNLFAKTYILSTGIFSDYFLNQYSGLEINREEYILYIARERIFPILFLFILGLTKYKKTAGILCLLWTGFSSGLILTTAVLKLNIKGILFCLIGISPHFICYIAAYIMLLIYYMEYPNVRWNHSKTLSLIIFILLGIISESYINPVLMEIFINTL